jgi:hypothetical protein
LGEEGSNVLFEFWGGMAENKDVVEVTETEM